MKVELKTTKLANGEIYGYRERAGGHIPLLLIHGNMTSSKHWDLLIDELSVDFKVYAVDLRGFGQSTYHERITEISDFSHDIKLFVDRLGLKAFHLMGWSMGGAVAMHFAADNTQYILSLILLASSSTKGYPFFSMDNDGNFTKRLTSLEEIEQDPIKTIPVVQAYKTKNKEFLRQVWESTIYTINKPGKELYEDYLDDMCTQRNISDVYQALNIFNMSHEHNGITEGTGNIDKILAPTLILWGENDQVVLKSMTDQLVKDFGDRAEVITLNGCGHSPLVDDIEQLNAKVEAFIYKQER